MTAEISAQRARGRDRAAIALAAGWAVLALGPVIAIFALYALSPHAAMNDYLSDDAYYYLRVAANMAKGAGSTFGNLVATNGYHPLWQLVLVPVVKLAPGDAALPAVFAVSSIAWIICVALYRRIGQACDAETPFLLGGVYLCWLCTYALPGSAGLLFLGMETTLVMPLLFLLIRQSQRHAIFEPKPQSLATLLTFGATLALLVLSRLDAGFIAAMFVLVTLAMRRKLGINAWRDAIIMSAPLALTLIIYVALNRYWFGVALPVSGTAKALGAPFLNSNPLTASLWGASTFQFRTLPMGLVFVAFTAMGALLDMRRAEAPRTTLWLMAAVLFGGVVLHLIYLCVGSSWPIWAWYGYGRAALGAMLLPLAIAALWQILRRQPVAWAAAAFAAVLLLGSGATIAKRLSLGGNETSYWVHSQRDAQTLNTLLPPDAVVAMGDLAGSLAYRLDRPVVQLEGLVEGADYLRALAQPGGAIAYLAKHKVSFIAAADYRIMPCPEAPLDDKCVLLTEPKFGGGPKVSLRVFTADQVFHDQKLTVWRYRPDKQTP